MMSNFIVEDLKRIVKGDNPLSKIILANVIFFLVTNLLRSVIPFHEFLGLPGNALEALFKPWTIITYMFMHVGFMHILFNMLWLYWMGQLVQEYLGNKRLISIYFLGGIAGGLTYIAIYSFLAIGGSTGMGSILMGASAGVMAVVIAAATLLPDYNVQLFLIGRVPLKYLALGILILTSLLDFSVNMGGKLAHLGGAALGYLFVRSLQSGNDWSGLVYGLFKPFSGVFKSKPKMRVVHNQGKSKTRQTKKSAEPTTADQKTDQKRIDAILDKISASGYDALTAEEKEILFRASNKK